MRHLPGPAPPARPRGRVCPHWAAASPTHLHASSLESSIKQKHLQASPPGQGLQCCRRLWAAGGSGRVPFARRCGPRSRLRGGHGNWRALTASNVMPKFACSSHFMCQRLLLPTKVPPSALPHPSVPQLSFLARLAFTVTVALNSVSLNNESCMWLSDCRVRAMLPA